MGIGNAEAQILKKLKKKVQQATEEVLTDKAAEELAEETEQALDTFFSDANEERRQQMMDSILTQQEAPIPTEKAYHFNTKVIYEMITEQDGVRSEVAYNMWFSDQEQYMGTQVSASDPASEEDIPATMMTILDDKNQAAIILMEEQKIAQAIGMERLYAVDVEEGTDTYFESLEKTGKTKKILGYDCDQYLASNADMVCTFWITNDLEIYREDMFFNLNKSLGGNTFGKVPDGAKGFLMEMSFEHKSKNEKGRMLVKDIQEKNNTIEMNSYRFMNLSNLMQQEP